MPLPDADPQADPRVRGVRLEEDQPSWQPWRDAWDQALFGPDGFYRRPEGPAGHFRTATHAAGDVLAEALVRMAAEHGCSAIVDVGAGRGELLTAVHRLGAGLRLHGVDVVPRPPSLPEAIAWSAVPAAPPGMEGPRGFDGSGGLPSGTLRGALVVAWELLDTVPCVLVETDPDGVARVVEVDPATGDERLGAAGSSPAEGQSVAMGDREWCERWWPVAGRPGVRAEIGATRDVRWAQLVRRAQADGAAVLLAVDYAHGVGARPDGGSLAGYRGGRLVVPVPDGNCDITAHVAMDAVAAAGEAAGARTVRLATQRDALRDLGVTGRLPPGVAVTATGLARMSREAELIDPRGLGAFAWLVQTTGPSATTRVS